MKPPLFKSPSAARIFSAATQQCSVWKERLAQGALCILQKWWRQILMQNLHTFPFPSHLCYFIVFQAPLSGFKQSATDKVWQLPGWPICSCVLLVPYAACFREPYIQRGHPRHSDCPHSSNPTGRRLFCTHAGGFALQRKRPEQQNDSPLPGSCHGPPAPACPIAVPYSHPH